MSFWGGILFEVSVVLLILLVIERALIRVEAKWRYRILGLGLLKLAFPVMVSSPTSLFSWAVTQESSPFIFSSKMPKRHEPAQGFQAHLHGTQAASLPKQELGLPQASQGISFIGGAYLIGIAVFLSFLSMGAYRLEKIRAHGVRAPDLEARLRKLTDPLRFAPFRNAKPRVVFSTEVSRPQCWGLLRPIIALPPGLERKLSERELEMVLLHEWTHFRHRDPWVRSASLLLLSLWWIHPLAWLLSRRLMVVQEDLCDDVMVERAGFSRTEYGSVLIKMSRSLKGEAPSSTSFAISMHAGTSGLVYRVYRLLNNKPLKGGFRMIPKFLCLGLAITLIPTLDTRGQEETKSVAEVLRLSMSKIKSSQNENGSLKAGQDHEAALVAMAQLAATRPEGYRDPATLTLTALSGRFAEIKSTWTLDDALTLSVLGESVVLSRAGDLHSTFERGLRSLEQAAGGLEEWSAATTFWSLMALVSAMTAEVSFDTELIPTLYPAMSSRKLGTGWTELTRTAAQGFLDVVYGKSDKVSLQKQANAWSEKMVAHAKQEELRSATLYLGSMFLYQAGGASFRSWTSRLEPLLCDFQGDSVADHAYRVLSLMFLQQSGTGIG